MAFTMVIPMIAGHLGFLFLTRAEEAAGENRDQAMLSNEEIISTATKTS